MYRYYLPVIVLIVLAAHSKQEYIRSPEITLHVDEFYADKELINLNKLMKQQSLSMPVVNLLFKIVEDSKLVNYIGLKCETNERCSLVLRKQLNFDDICESSSSSSGNVDRCNQLLKIIVINQNDFIEIPITVLRSNIIDFKLIFGQADYNLNLTNQFNTFYLPSAQISSNQPLTHPFQLQSLLTQIEYTLQECQKPLPGSALLNLVKVGSALEMQQLKLEFNFTEEHNLTDNQKCCVQILAYVPNQERIENASANVWFKFSSSSKLKDYRQIKPIEFEYPVYSVNIEDNEVESDAIVLEPKLKESVTEPLMYTLILKNDDDKNTKVGDLPFYVDANSGKLKLKESIFQILNDTVVNQGEKSFSFGIKVTYKQLLEENRSDQSSKQANYYYDYIIPGFARIEVKFSRKKSNIYKQIPKIESQFLTSFVSKYEILNEDTANQTLVYYINDPIQLNSKLIKFYLKSNDTIRAKPGMSWSVVQNDSNFMFAESSSNITLMSKSDFKDQNNYKTTMKLVDKNGDVLTELNVEFRVDYDPILFERDNFNLYLTQANLLEQNLIQIKVKDRLNKNVTKNVAYRIRESEDNQYFDINPLNGWLSVRQVLVEKNYYEITVIANNKDLQKSGLVKCKIHVECFASNSPAATLSSSNSNQSAKYTIFDQSSNRTQIGIFKSICHSSQKLESEIRPSYKYSLSKSGEVFIRFCSKQNHLYCKKFNLNRLVFNTEKTFHELIILDMDSGYLMTNFLIDVNSLAAQINDDYFQKWHGDNHIINEDIFDSNVMSLLFKVNMDTGLAANGGLTYSVEIMVNNVPKVVNFNDKLTVMEIINNDDYNMDSSHENEKTVMNQCLFYYKFSTTDEEALKSSLSGIKRGIASKKNSKSSSRTLLSSERTRKSSMSSLSTAARFVKVDQALGQQSEAEFKISECSASFFIHNNGCLALRTDHIDRNERCQKLSTIGQSDNIYLKSGTYIILFKLCYYNNNKVSCSQFYNQTLLVPIDVTRWNAKHLTASPQNLQVSIDNDSTTPDHFFSSSLHTIHTKRPADHPTRANNYGVYLFVLLGVVVLIALLAISALLFTLFRQRSTSSNSDKSFVLPKSSAISSTSSNTTSASSKADYNRDILEVSCETSHRNSSSSNGGSNAHTPETSSNAPTTSSKLSSRLEEEDDDMINQNKILQVIDDDYSKVNLVGSKLVIENAQNDHSQNEKFNYAGSFSSIQSSTQSYHNEQTKREINTEGMYSVKNASILVSPILFDKPDSYFKANLIDVPHQSENSFTELYNNTANSERIQQQHPMKMNSLKQLKKELALKKAVGSTTAKCVNNNSIHNEKVLEVNNFYHENSFQYLTNNNEMLPDQVIASVV